MFIETEPLCGLELAELPRCGPVTPRSHLLCLTAGITGVLYMGDRNPH